MDRQRKAIKAVVDTNVIAYYLLGTPNFIDEVQKFWGRISDPLAPSLWEAEIANVVWMSVRGGAIASEDAPLKLGLAGRLGIHSVANKALWHGALMRSIESGVAIYDTLFIELADRESLPLATFDEKVLKAYPAIAKRPKELL